MKKSFYRNIVLLLGMIIFSSSLIFAGTNENAGIVFDLDATTAGNQDLITIPSQPAETNIRVDVYCIGVHNLDTYEFEIVYDPAELAFVGAYPTNPITYEENILTSNGGEAIGWMVDSSIPGILSLAYTLAGTDSLEAPEGEGLIADIVFQSLVETHGNLTFDDVRFIDFFGVMDSIRNKGKAILYDYGNIDGTVTNSITHDPIGGAIVSIGDFTDTTNTDGTYFLEYIPLGVHNITCTAEEYNDTIEVAEVLKNQAVTVNLALEPLARGTLDGTVTDINTSEPIEDALIIATSQNKIEYTSYTNAEGYYIINSLVVSDLAGDYTVTCDAGYSYNPGEITGVIILENDTTHINFELDCLLGILQGTVKDGLGFPIEGAVVTATSEREIEYQDTTDSNGCYTIQEILEDTYDVSCFAYGYNIPMIQPAEIVGDEVTAVNFCLAQPTMNISPASITETVPVNEPLAIDIHIVNDGDGELEWNANISEPVKGIETDYSSCTAGVLKAENSQTKVGNVNNGFVAEKNLNDDDIIIHYDDGTNYDRIGLSDGGTFMVAARFTPTELETYYDDYQISNVGIFIYDMPSKVSLKVWEGGSVGNPGTEIYSEDVTSYISQQSWAAIPLSSPIALVADNEYWIGYIVTHKADLCPAGCDAGPAVDEKGDWIYVAPGPWDELQNYGSVVPYDWNWNIRATLTPRTWIALTHDSGIVEAGGDSTVTVYFDTIDYTAGEILQASIDFVSIPDVGTTSIPVNITVGGNDVSEEPGIHTTQLYGNFPNPFSSSTIIKFCLKKATHVKLSVYNIRGQLVEKLIDGDMAAGIDYQIQWNGISDNKEYASGIYFYKLETNEKTFLKKMIFIK